ncbi:hypothetical protein MSG28_015313, partial [Choristoneura fumiferana]
MALPAAANPPRVCAHECPAQFHLTSFNDYCVGLWRGADEKAYVMWDPHGCGPAGRSSPGGAAGVFLFSTVEELADTFRENSSCGAIVAACMSHVRRPHLWTRKTVDQ